MRVRTRSAGSRAAFALSCAAIIAIAACSAAGQPATPARTASSTPAATVGPSGPSSPPAPSFATTATLRTIAASTEAPGPLVIGPELASNDVYTSHAATYASGGLTISGVLHEPKAAGPHPGVVIVHGFVDPATYVRGGELQREQDYLARAGYIVLYPDLRGLAGSDAPPSGPPDLDMGSVEDVVNAIGALRASNLPGLDPGRIGLLGHSLGGLLVLDVLVAKPGLVDAVVAFAPSSSVTFENVQRFLVPGDPAYDAVIAAHGTPDTNPSYWADISPRTFVGQVTEPLLIVHGDADGDVPHQWSVDTVTSWKQAGKVAELVTLEGEDHVFEARWSSAMEAVAEFFAANLQ